MNSLSGGFIHLTVTIVFNVIIHVSNKNYPVIHIGSDHIFQYQCFHPIGLDHRAGYPEGGIPEKDCDRHFGPGE